MKCPKCGYLGFETTDRCRNCQYDFSLAPFAADPDLVLQSAERSVEHHVDLDLPPIKRPTDPPAAGPLDLDRLFGEEESASPAASAMTASVSAAQAASAVADDVPTPLAAPVEIEIDIQPVVQPAESVEPVRSAATLEPVVPAAPPEPEIPAAPPEPLQPVKPVKPVEPLEPSESLAPWDALPFEEPPIVPPPAARPPLSVRRATPEVPRQRPRTTRPIKPDSLQLEPEPTAAAVGSVSTAETVASLMELPSLGTRVGAGAIDAALLIALDAAVLYLTLRITGLSNSIEDVRVLPPIPFIGFLVLLGFCYLATFTVAGGQTIGKMLLSLRVIGDDGRPIDVSGGVMRAAGCLLVPFTLGLSYLPVLVTSDHRALHDRLAGTRVVRD